MSKTEQKKNTKINLHIYVLKPLLSPKKKAGAWGVGERKGREKRDQPAFSFLWPQRQYKQTKFFSNSYVSMRIANYSGCH